VREFALSSPKVRKSTQDRTNDHDMRIRAAWLYYMEGLTQEQVARRLDISRLKTLRILAACRDEGIVQIRVNGKQAQQIALETELKSRLGLAEAVVVPTPEDPAQLSEIIGQAAGAYISDQVQDGVSIGVGWGGTLQNSLRSLSWRAVDRMTVVSLLGGMTHAISFNPSAFAFKMADVFKAECYHLTTPVFVSSKSMRDALWAEPAIQEVFQRGQRVDLAVVSVGDMNANATLFRSGVLTQTDRQELRAAGAVGDILCHFVDAKGNPVDHPLNQRVMAFNPLDLRKLQKVVIASGGLSKVEIITLAIRTTDAKVLITDEKTARGILERARKPGGKA
jgi:DNA-binding transcriptional regulator LsrR (DeoR family)